jgi:ribosomal protein L37AE/L43A
MVKGSKTFLVRQQRQADRCHRCGGLMVQEKVFEINAFDWRCVSCGERIDPVILSHREAYHSKGLVREEAEKLFVSHGQSRLN